MKIVLAVLGVHLALLLPGSASALEIPLCDGPTRLELLSHSQDAMHFRLDLGQLTVETVDTPGGGFTLLRIPGMHTTKTEGAPQLPLVNKLLEIPHSADVTVEILSVLEQEVDLRALGFKDPLIPAQPPRSKSQDPADYPFVYDRESYQAAQVGRPLVQVVDCGRLRAVRIGRLEVAPVVYRPGDNSMKVVRSVEFRLRFSGADRQAEDRLKALTASPFFTSVYQRILGYTDADKDTGLSDLVRDVVTMVIVTPPQFVDQLAEFIDWKTRRGFHMVLAVTGTPEVGSTKEEIQNYLHGLYNEATPQQPAPSFVTFVGDVDQTPTWIINGSEDYPSDRPYCNVDNDMLPDMYYGRFSAVDSLQLAAIVDKTLMYEQFTMSDPSYLENTVMVVGDDLDYAAIWGNGQMLYGQTHYFNSDHGLACSVYCYPESVFYASAIIQNVNNGVNLLNYSGHGLFYLWGAPYFTQRDVWSLQNSERYCLTIVNACLTAKFDYPTCIGENWLLVRDRGGIGYIGASSFSYWDEDYWWAVGAGDILLHQTYEGSGLGAFDGLFHDHGEDPDNWFVTNDAIVFCGNLAVMEAGSGKTRYYWYVYNLLGDPSLSTYFGVPLVNPVNHASVIDVNSTLLSLSANLGSYCGLSQDGVLMGAGTVDIGGTLEMEIWGDLVAGQAELVVTAQNRVPYRALIEVGDELSGLGNDLPTGSLGISSIHPNPFNPRTVISFELEWAGRAELEIYDVQGHHIATLLDRELSAGPHKVVWRGRDGQGRPVASGVYFARLQADRWTLTEKMMLVR